MSRTIALMAALTVLPTALAAQVDCSVGHLPNDSHEARIFGNFAVPIAFSAARSPSAFKGKSVTIGLEGAYLPKLNASTRTPTYCRPGKPPENTNILFAFPRPRIIMAGPSGIFVEASWIPPIRLHGVKANLLAVAIGRAVPAGLATIQLRAHATFGTVHGPITCDANAIQDPNSECSVAPAAISDDSYKPTVWGVEFSVGRSFGYLHPYLGGGYNRLMPRFQVTRTGQRVETNLGRFVAFGGVTLAAAHGFGLTGEVYTAPADAITGRVMVSYTLAGKH